MTVTRALVVPVVALATLFCGVLETLGMESAQPGVVRTHPGDLEATASEQPADAEADDTDGGPDDRDWHGGLPAHTTRPPHNVGRLLATGPLPPASRRGCSPTPIRGPPTRA